MGTLGGFPSPPALWLRRAKPGFAYAIMGTLGGFPSPPALVRAEQSSAALHAARALSRAGGTRTHNTRFWRPLLYHWSYCPRIMGTLRGFPNPPALWLRRAKPGYANAVDGNPNDEPPVRFSESTHALAPRPRRLALGEACLCQRVRGNPRNASEEWRSGSTNHFVSLCSVCFRHLLQNFDSLSFSAFARLFFVLE
jgi:hypothetical protein